MARKKRYVIGIMIANIVDPFSNQAACGAISAAEELDADLIIIPGKYICETSFQNEDTTYEYQYNNLFAYAGERNLDAVCVCTGTIAYANTDEEKKAFLDRIGKNIPVISIASKLDGYEYVVFDNAGSVRDAANYIIKENGAKKVAMLSGYVSNSDYKERLDGYMQALEDNGIAFDEDLVCFANPSRACKGDLERLLDKHPDIDGLICSNDDMCLAVYEVCADRGMRIGSDIFVVGFDDMDYSEKLDPPLASVRASAEYLAYRAVKNAVDLLEGRQIETRNVPTRFIPRGSCGYHGRRKNDVEMLINYGGEERFKKMIYFMYDGTDICYDTYIVRNMRVVYDLITDLEAGRELTDDKVSDVLEAVGKMMDYHKEYFLFLKNIHVMADGIYDSLCEKNLSENSKKNLENLYLEIYRLISRDIGAQISQAGERSIDLLRRSNIVVRDTLTIDGTGDKAFADILKRLPLLEVNSSYLYLLPEPARFRPGDKMYDISRWRFVAYQRFDDIFTVPERDRDIKIDNLFKNRYLTDGNRHTLVMADLFSGENQFGILLVELKKQFFEYLEFICYQFGAAVKILSLIGELERHMNELHEDNAALKDISRADELTGLLNRRGFNDESKLIAEKYKNSGGYAVLVFADLDYLKFINDKYGHDEGDFALRASADILRHIFRSTDIIGRTGGDEFNVLAIVNEPGLEEKILARKKACVDEVNATSGKPYRIDLSMGIYQFECSKLDDLSDAIKQADNRLYEVKRLRTYNPYLEE
ncbi:MAG: GGDEF domain-containing protein [Ruminococcus sp.]|nr:GGDEF domain-containing protein [Ruminococcus sp.]